MIDFLEICRRANTGPLVQEEKFDRDLFFPNKKMRGRVLICD
jgi:hypothetical protein